MLRRDRAREASKKIIRAPVNNEMDAVRHRPDLMRTCGLVAFAWIAFAAHGGSLLKRAISLVVLLNGLMCHMTQTCVWTRVDVWFNAIILALGNLISTRQPYTLLSSLVALLMWLFVARGVPCRAWVHVVGVQWVLAHEFFRVF